MACVPKPNLTVLYLKTRRLNVTRNMVKSPGSWIHMHFLSNISGLSLFTYCVATASFWTKRASPRQHRRKRNGK